MSICSVNSPLGNLILISDGENLIGVQFEEQGRLNGIVYKEVSSKLKIFADTKNWLNRYFIREKPDPLELPLAPAGTDFRRAVWEILCKIPYGQTLTYGEIAQQLAKNVTKMSARAVGGAVGHNPIPIIIPCHRVIGAKGNLTGYSGGIDKKIKLLMHEGAM